MIAFKDILKQGLWTNNVATVQLLGLCPLLAVTTTLIDGLGLGLATVFVITGSNLIVSLSRRWLMPQLRIPVFVLIVATLVTVVELLLHAWFDGLYRRLGIFVPLIVTNCAILARAELFASRQPALAAAVDGLATGGGFAAVLVLLGAIRELLGAGTLFAGARRLLGPAADGLTLHTGGHGLLLFALPPGAFMALAGLIAASRHLSSRRRALREALADQPAPADAGS